MRFKSLIVVPGVSMMACDARTTHSATVVAMVSPMT